MPGTRSLGAVVALLAALAGTAGPAWAIGSDYQTTVPFGSFNRPIGTARGPAYVTGGFGSLETTTLPGSGSQGLLMNNGNGTSTLIAPGATPQVVATPR